MAEHDSVIPAGGSGKLVAKVHTSPRQNGRISKTIRVFTDDPGLRTVMLRLTAKVEAPIVMTPSQRIWLTTQEGRGVWSRLLLHRRDGRPLRVLEVESVPAPLRVRFAAVTKATSIRGVHAVPGDLWLIAEIPGDAQPVVRSGSLALRTNVPGRAKLDIPVSLRIRPLIEPAPPRIRFVLPNQGGKEVWRILRLTHGGRKPFRILSAVSDHPDLIGVTAGSAAAAVTHDLRVTLDNARAAAAHWGSLRATVTIRTDDPSRPTVSVPVIVVRRTRSGRGRIPRTLRLSREKAPGKPAGADVNAKKP